MLASSTDYELEMRENALVVHPRGSWTISQASQLEGRLARDVASLTYTHVDYDMTGLVELDTAGAYLLARAIRHGVVPAESWDVCSGSNGHKTLMSAATSAVLGREPETRRQWYDAFARIGQATIRFWEETVAFFAFLGQFFVVMAKVIAQPKRLRWRSIVSLVESVGFDAAPIVMLLSFFIGAVIAYMGANLLASFGASVFMVDLVGFSILRELAVIITAILLAGRSDSAFTASIGAMKMRQEIDAMKVMGLDTFEVLVVPRVIACLIAMPILTFLAMMSGLAGGLLVAWATADITPILFFNRLNAAVGIQNLWVGLVKTPIFGVMIAIIGCRQGLAVTGSVESLGQRTTTAVVQAIFSVILVNAMFAILFYQMGV
ncbi:MlaE family ABC transporter permease [Litorimonas cladophorae]|nr:ABC transporter permease [Litorimonas cladophorae]